jgi:hypothetical protein
MVMRIVVNGREVTNPAAKAAIGSILLSLIALVLSLVVFVVLPVIGVAVGLGLGIAAVTGGTLGLGLPLLRRRALRGGGEDERSRLEDGRRSDGRRE